ncbi:MFS transporter [Gordonia bronchialis]|uniref:MFS transporter n=1 Tax=Gordonia bronchialis TaxID=2054 RepID=UPI00226EF441|nr:MFS transporter [Gordonia bronchialis]
MTTTVDAGTAPPRAGLVLTALILVAGVANINLAVANVALPDIGRELDASSTQLNLIAVGYSLGLAASVLYFGALGDRHGRKMTVILGTGLTIPASLVAGLAGNVEVLFGARVVGGVAAGLALIPSDHGDDDAKVDNLGGLLSIVMVGALVLALNFAPESDMRMTVYILAAIAIIGIGCFVYRQLHVRVPLFDLRIASRRTFWVAAVGGLIVFGTLMGAMFIGQQFMQNVLGYSTLASGATILVGAAAMVVVAPRSAKLVEARGSRFTLLCGYISIVVGLLLAMLTWDENAQFWHVGTVYLFVGIGVGLAGTPASRSLTGSVPVQRAGMASSMSDLQRDLGGAILQSILGSILTAGYANHLRESIASSPNADQVTSQTETALTKSFSSAEVLAERYPQYAEQIIAAARDAFVHGDTLAYGAAVLIVLAGAVVVFLGYPRRDHERALMKTYAAESFSDGESDRASS